MEVCNADKVFVDGENTHETAVNTMNNDSACRNEQKSLPISDPIIQTDNAAHMMESIEIKQGYVSDDSKTKGSSEIKSDQVEPQETIGISATDMENNDCLIKANPIVSSMLTAKDVVRGLAQTVGKKKNSKDVKMGDALSQLLAYSGMSDSDDSAQDSEDSSSESESDSESTDRSDALGTKSSAEISSSVLINSDFREIDSSSSSSDCDSDSSDSEIGAWGITKVTEAKPTPENTKSLRTIGEMSLDDLPPIENLQISVPEQECVEIGVVTSVIEQLVIVQSYPGTSAFDIDTLFFLDRGERPLGRIFDVLGPVTEPYYAIRFNTHQQAIDTGVKPGTPVYCAPNTPHTAFVFVSELLKVKGSDASWEHNNEPPLRFLDYSDDEVERMAKKQLHSKPSATGRVGPKNNSLERAKKFERQMNNRNILMTERFQNQPSSSQMPQGYCGPSFMPPPHSWGTETVQYPLGFPNPPFQAYQSYSNFVQYRPTTLVPHTPARLLTSTIPTPAMRPPGVQYVPAAPRPWAPPNNSVLKPPNGNFGSQF